MGECITSDGDGDDDTSRRSSVGTGGQGRVATTLQGTGKCAVTGHAEHLFMMPQLWGSISPTCEGNLAGPVQAVIYVVKLPITYMQ